MPCRRKAGGEAQPHGFDSVRSVAENPRVANPGAPSGWRRARCRRRMPKNSLPADDRQATGRLDQATSQRFEAERNAGDPGPVLARRLSNAEYDYTIRDLTGVDIRPTREFPVDPANEAGFDNSGESLAMSPALLQEVPGGGAARRRPRRPEAGGLRLRAAPGRHRHRPRQVLRPADHRLLPAAAGRSTPTTSWPPGGISIASALGKPDATWPTSPRRAGLSAKYLRDGLVGR